jgi:hypothetical protein
MGLGLGAVLPGTSSGHDTIQYTLLPSMPSSIHKDRDDHEQSSEDRPDLDDFNDPDAEFGGTEERKQLEKKLLWKLDLRMSVLVVIYILNYVRALQSMLYTI